MHDLTPLDLYADLPFLMERLSKRDSRAFRRGILSAGPTQITPDPIWPNHDVWKPRFPKVSAASARALLGEEEMPTPEIHPHHSWIFTLKQTFGDGVPPFVFDSRKIAIKIDHAQCLRRWNWARTFPAQMHRPWGRIDLLPLPVEVQAFPQNSEKSHFKLCQEKVHTTMLLEIFKGKLKRIPSLLSVAEAQLAMNVRFVEHHVLAKRTWSGKHDMYCLQERLVGPTERTSEISYEPPSEGVVPMRNFLNAFTHFTYWYTNQAAVINGFQYVGNTIFDSLIVDHKYDWHAGYLSARISHFERDHRCNSLCRGLRLNERQ